MRSHTARTPFHCVRSAMLALAAVTLAGGAHVLAGGQLPAPGILFALLALTCLATTAATRLRLNAATLTGLLGAGQLVLHEAFTVSDHALSRTGSAGQGSSPHHLDPIAIALPVEQVQLHSPDSPLAFAMFAGHALATLVCALFLAKGEDALWALAAWLRPLLKLRAVLPADAIELPPVASVPEGNGYRPRRNVPPDCRRGPPAAVVSS